MPENHSQQSGFNRLAEEKSPYLLQHAQNPVNWFPWGEEALNRAVQQQRPIFISIGYSTCHWCHVMAHESFEDPEVADKLNQHFIAIKVDREERPDLDASYMQACQLLSGQGGWPLNLFLTPEGKPFYALTYAPKHNRYGHPGFCEILDKITELWKEQRNNLLSAANQLTDAVRHLEASQQQIGLDTALLKQAAKNFQRTFDPLHAGFGQAPKFPQPHNASLLLRLGELFADDNLSLMALTTLRHIDQGGVTDQLGGGLHRYSVDQRWLVPHFEKMLYDQALIAGAYLDGWLQSDDETFRCAAESIFQYVLRKLQHPPGGFYCGEDADSEGKEGTCYLWSLAEITEILEPDQAELCIKCFNLTVEGNFEGKNIPHRRKSWSQLAEEHKLSTSALERQITTIKTKLMRVRNQRPQPHLDDKILTGWNGLMIGSLARGGYLLSRKTYLDAAYRASEMIRSELVRDGRLMRRFRDGETAIPAFHEDYAYLIWGLIELFLADFKPEILAMALSLEQQREALFADGGGGYFDTAEEFIDGLGRGRNKQDGATPAAASVTAENLIRLARLTAAPELEERAENLLSRHLLQAADYPTSHAFLLQGLYTLLRPQPLVMIIKPVKSDLDKDWQGFLKSCWPQPLAIITESPENYVELIPHLRGKSVLNGQVTAWLCTNQSCLPPLTAVKDLQQALDGFKVP